MSWQWPKTDRAGLARFVQGDVAQEFDLGLSRNELSPDAQGRRDLVNAIYLSLQEKRLRYALEKYHPDDAVQLIRTPTEIISQKEGTCLDLALLFCGVCLGNELVPQVVLIEGHALATVSLNHDLRSMNALDRKERKYFGDALLTDVNAIRQLVSGGAYVAVECTGFAQAGKLPSSAPEGVGRDVRKVLSFDRALAAGAEQLNFTARPFLFALDIPWANELGFNPQVELAGASGNAGQAKTPTTVVLGQNAEIEDTEIGNATGIKGGDAAGAKVDILSGSKLKKVKIDSLVGIDNSGDNTTKSDI